KKQISKLATDRNGLTQAVLSQGVYEETRVIASHEDDVAIVAPYRFNLSSDPSRDWTGYIYTDRPVYRPGHSLHFKGILRARNGEKYRVPTGQVTVTIQDPEGKQVFQKELTVSQFGTITGNYDVPQDAALGYYSISVSNRSGRAYAMNGGFHVEEYKKPEYEVKITAEKPRVLEGEKITATIEARYYFGEPVAGAEVKYVVHTSNYWAPFLERDEDENPGDAEGPDTEGGEEGAGYDYAGQQESEQSGKLDANGKLRITIPTRLDAHHSDLVYRVEARVTDESRREIAGHNAVVATYGSFLVGVTPDSYLYRKNESIRAQIFAKDYAGKPVHTAVHVQLIRPKRSYPSEQEEVTLQAQDVTTDDHGNATVQFAASEAGSLIMRVSAKTPEDREVRADAWTWIQGDDQNESWWGNGARRQIQIIPDKKSYKPGETARLLIMTGVTDAHVLVTTEGRTIQSKRIVEAKGQSVAVEVPVLAENQPNFYVSAVFIKDNKLYQGSKNLKVPADQQKLSIAIEPSKPQFQPGEKASYTITAKDANGKPVAGDFSLGVVDEAIYAIQPENVGDIHQFFYGSVYDQVLTDSSLSFYFTGQAGKRPMILAEAAAQRSLTLGQLKPSEPLAQPKVRKAFPDTALWLADVKTDQSGRARAQLEFPDSLTTWRATVRGATADTKVGSAVERVIVRKNLMVRLAVPRFFRQGDEVTISAIVHNYLPDAKDVQVSMDLRGLDVIDGTTRQINVASKADTRVDWRVRAQNVREATILTKALATGESDAMELSLPVIPFGVKLADAKADALTDPKQQVETTMNLRGDPQQAAQTLDISVSPSIAGSIFGALDYLTSYPYGCTEQTMSSFLPNIVVAKAMKDFGLQSTVNTAELDKKIKAGLDRLYDYQHDDGGWGWWKEDESQVFMTAYVVSGLGQAKAAGYKVAQDKLDRAESICAECSTSTKTCVPICALM
ncbi:MAG TPA: MG2 domain-containing protein, partial [Terriglobales bacterium]